MILTERNVRDDRVLAPRLRRDPAIIKPAAVGFQPGSSVARLLGSRTLQGGTQAVLARVPPRWEHPPLSG